LADGLFRGWMCKMTSHLNDTDQQMTMPFFWLTKWVFSCYLMIQTLVEQFCGNVALICDKVALCWPIQNNSIQVQKCIKTFLLQTKFSENNSRQFFGYIKKCGKVRAKFVDIVCNTVDNFILYFCFVNIFFIFIRASLRDYLNGSIYFGFGQSLQ